MANITAQDINQLRKQTGVGLMDCKQALIEADGDVSKAIDILRKKGQKVANKRADKEANEGIAIARANNDNTFAAIFILTCETDFVSKGEEFGNAANMIMDTAIANKIKTTDELMSAQLTNGNGLVSDLINDLLGKIQEKIEIVNFEVFEAPYIAAYIHHNKKIATLVGFQKTSNNIEEVGKDIAMQVAAMAPVAIDENVVSQEIIDKELEIARDLIRQEGKPEDMVEKIAQGKLNKFFKESTLLNQQYIKDSNLTVKAYLESIDKDLKVTLMKRVSFA
jgi:elongation factor Ts